MNNKFSVHTRGMGERQGSGGGRGGTEGRQGRRGGRRGGPQGVALRHPRPRGRLGCPVGMGARIQG